MCAYMATDKQWLGPGDSSYMLLYSMKCALHNGILYYNQNESTINTGLYSK